MLVEIFDIFLSTFLFSTFFLSTKLQHTKLLPPDERTIHKWNGGPYDLDDGDGFSEEDPTVFLLSYWGMTFARLLDFN